MTTLKTTGTRFFLFNRKKLSWIKLGLSFFYIHFTKSLSHESDKIKTMEVIHIKAQTGCSDF